ncbi:hypothetical protein JOC85_001173 [Bacillus mesophilus]|uniref:Uncharacterized protein n=1 Tax=Bacillus mesophilus TaxID=1808955 RepID=A0A6M0Q4G5_9BACI|nr:hypothetical protein [Bacillus mesophilus]MBM7660406.1 hypothetical protein [Bacillus mesophilus]NEY71113.1 hypothetical protein [Bacillus mesophilus]
MENIRKYLPGIDTVFIISIISYGVVYAFNYGAFLQAGIPISLIEVGVNNLVKSLFVLLILLIVYIPTLINVSISKSVKNKILQTTGMSVLAIVFLVIESYVVFWIIVLIIGWGIIILLRDRLSQIVFIVMTIFYIAFGSVVLGYINSFSAMYNSEEHYIINMDNKRYLYFNTYNGNYIVSEIINKNNDVLLEFQLIPITNGNKPIIIKQEKININIVQ